MKRITSWILVFLMILSINRTFGYADDAGAAVWWGDSVTNNMVCYNEATQSVVSFPQLIANVSIDQYQEMPSIVDFFDLVDSGEMKFDSWSRKIKEAAYGQTDMIVNNVPAMWGIFKASDDMKAQTPNPQDPNNTSFDYTKSATTLRDTVNEVLESIGEKDGLIEGETSQEVFNELANLAGSKGTFFYGQEGQNVQVGDIAMVTITAHIDPMEVNFSRIHESIPIGCAAGGQGCLPKSEKDIEPAFPLQTKGQKSKEVIEAASVTYTLIGLVTEFSAEAGCHIVSGGIDLAGVGVTSVDGKGVSDGKGTISYKTGETPDWGIDITTTFTHNIVGIKEYMTKQKYFTAGNTLFSIELKGADGKLLRDADGKPLSIDDVMLSFLGENDVYMMNGKKYSKTASLARMKYCYNYLTQEGNLPPDSAAAIMACMIEESGGIFSATLEQLNGPGRGLCQWETFDNGGSGRYIAMQRYLSYPNDNLDRNTLLNRDVDNVCPPTEEGKERAQTLDGQLEFLLYELRTVDGYSSLYRQLTISEEAIWKDKVDEYRKIYEGSRYDYTPAVISYYKDDPEKNYMITSLMDLVPNKYMWREKYFVHEGDNFQFLINAHYPTFQYMSEFDQKIVKDNLMKINGLTSESILARQWLYFPALETLQSHENLYPQAVIDIPIISNDNYTPANNSEHIVPIGDGATLYAIMLAEGIDPTVPENVQAVLDLHNAMYYELTGGAPLSEQQGEIKFAYISNANDITKDTYLFIPSQAEREAYMQTSSFKEIINKTFLKET